MALPTISDLTPSLAVFASKWMIACQNEFNDARPPSKLRITVTYRAPEDQKVAQITGRSNAAPGKSPHNCLDANGKPAARAFDFAIFNHDGSYVQDGTDPRYLRAGEIAESLGLFWAGRWNVTHDGANPDYDHIQLKNWRTFSEGLTV